MITQLIKARMDLSESSVLDVGCGSGVTIEHLSDLGAASVNGIELDPLALRTGSVVNDRISRGDFMEIELDATYDVVLMLDVLEHIEDDTGALEKVSGLMARDGILLVTVPAHQWLWSRHDVTNSHFRRYSARQVRWLLESSGFEVEQFGYMFAGLVLPKLIVRWLELMGFNLEKASVEIDPSSLLSRIAYRWFSMESAVAIRSNRLLPFGSSVVAVARPAGTH